MIKDVEDVLKVQKIRLKLHKRLTMRGLYYREMIKKIENPKRKIKVDLNEEDENKPYKECINGEGSLFDKIC